MTSQNKKYLKIGVGLLCAAGVSVVAFQNCGSTITPINGLTNASSMAAATCTGSYTFSPGSGATLNILTEDQSGNITGTLVSGSITGNITGTCITTNGFNSINFTRIISPDYQMFTGTMTQTSGGLSAWQMSGTYSTCSGGTCVGGTCTGGSCGGATAWSAPAN